MLGELVTLPARIGVRATRMGLHAAAGALAGTASAAEALLDVVTSRRGAARGPDPRDVMASEPSRPPAEPSRPPAEPSRPSAEPSPSISEEAAPAHVSEEPVLVEELAEPGAEDGAGAQVDVDEPWHGYHRLNAEQVIGRAAEATTAELAAIQLYESAHRGRRTILTAVKRELQSASAGRRS